MPPRPRRWPHVALALWALVVLLALTWPVYDILGNHIDPLVLGLPFSLFWIIAWSLATFGVLSAFYLITEKDA